MPEVIGVQFIKGGLVHNFYPAKNQDKLQLHDYCVVETEHGLQLAKVVHPAKHMGKQYLPEKLKPIIRGATDLDHEQFATNEGKEKEAYKFCRQKVDEKKLEMKLVDVSYSLDARKAVFYFTADNRVDFRELVKDLAHALKVKIEMRQIGVRDEARRLGGVGCCGRTLCCCTFLKDFVSVSIRMAKEQNLSLNPTKVSGLCGRLMCCLSYEYMGKGKHKKVDKNDERHTREKVHQDSEKTGEHGQGHECQNCQKHNQPEVEKASPTTSSTSEPAKPAGQQADKPATGIKPDQDNNKKKHHHYRRFKSQPKKQ